MNVIGEAGACSRLAVTGCQEQVCFATLTDGLPNHFGTGGRPAECKAIIKGAAPQVRRSEPRPFN